MTVPMAETEHLVPPEGPGPLVSKAPTDPPEAREALGVPVSREPLVAKEPLDETAGREPRDRLGFRDLMDAQVSATILIYSSCRIPFKLFYASVYHVC